MRRHGTLRSNEKIRPVVYGTGLYFLVAGTDSFHIGTIGSLLKIVVLVPLALALLDLRRFRIRFSATMITQLLFWILTILSLFYSLDADKTFSSVKALTLNLALIFCLGIMEDYNRRELQFMHSAMVAGGWVTIVLILLFSDISAGGRLTLILGKEEQDQNYINGYFLYAFSWHCYQLLLEKKKLHAIPVVFILAIVLFTGSRGALLAFMLVIFAHSCILFASTEHKMRNIALVGMLMVLLLVAFDLILAQMPESVAQRFSWDYIAEKGSTGRTNIWAFLFRHYSQDSIGRMLFGHGYGTTLLVNTLNRRVAHNLYLDNLISLGIVGLLLQLMIQGSMLRILSTRRLYPILGAYLGMLCMCMSLSLVSYKPIWNIMLLTLAIDSNHAASLFLYENKNQEVPL